MSGVALAVFIVLSIDTTPSLYIFFKIGGLVMLM